MEFRYLSQRNSCSVSPVTWFSDCFKNSAIWKWAFLAIFLFFKMAAAQETTELAPDFGSEPRVLSGHRKLVDSVAFSPDGRILASGSFDNTVKIWEPSTGKLIRTLKAPGNLHLSIPGVVGIFAIAFSPDGHYLASAGWNNVLGIWQMPSGDDLRTVRGWNWDWVVPAQSAFIDCVAFSPDSRYIATGGGDKLVRVADVLKGGEVRKFKGHTKLVRTVAFSPDGKSLATGSWDESVRVWDYRDGQLLQALEGHFGVVESVAFSPDGRYLAAATKNDIRLWDVATWKAVLTLSGHTGRVREIAFSPDDRWLASGSEDATVRLWAVGTGKPVAELSPHHGRITSVKFSQDGRVLAAGSEDSSVLVWETKN
jgi:WD40 repeat protein